VLMAAAVVSPHPQVFLDRLAGQVRMRSVLQGVIALAEQAPALTDAQMRARLSDLTGSARAGCRECGSRSGDGARLPAGRACLLAGSRHQLPAHSPRPARGPRGEREDPGYPTTGGGMWTAHCAREGTSTAS
jgi:hypothetical protein